MLAVIRVRGTTGVNPKADKTQSLMRLHHVNHMVLLNESETLRGMLQIAKDYITWGEIDESTLVEVLKTRVLLEGRKPLTESFLKEQMEIESFEALAQLLIEGKIKFSDIPNIIPVIRLHPPKGGYEYIRIQYQKKGTLGYRASEINQLIRKMLIPGVKVDGKGEN
jgi:large subunit ribosomal protein L30